MSKTPFNAIIYTPECRHPFTDATCVFPYRVSDDLRNAVVAGTFNFTITAVDASRIAKLFANQRSRGEQPDFLAITRGIARGK
jgi:hypothetical protein